MRDILGEVLGDSFRGITLKKYNKVLKKVEDKEDYETGKQALKDTEEQNEDEPDIEEDDQGGIDQIIDISKISAVLPPIYIYGLKLIEGYSGNFDAFKDLEEEHEIEKVSQISPETHESDNPDTELEMRPPAPLDIGSTLSIMKDEKIRFQKFYGFNQLPL